ncbi:MAG: hypothetical protein AAFX40_15490 [Cyanobacteria bacterium J06639_1]
MSLIYQDFQTFDGKPKLLLDSFTDLDILQKYLNIEKLHLEHWHKIESLNLEPLIQLKELRSLSLHTSMHWDGSNRHLLVDTFEPLTELPSLEVIEILGVIPKKDGLEPLGGISSLKEVSIGNTNYYQLEDFAWLSNRLPNVSGLEPITQMNFLTRCKKCDATELFLAGTKPRGKRYVCPRCNLKLIRRHLERWNLAGGSPNYSALERASSEQIYEAFRRKDLTELPPFL